MNFQHADGEKDTIASAFVVAKSSFFKKLASSEMYFRVQPRPVFFSSHCKELSLTQDVVENLYTLGEKSLNLG